MADQKDEVPKLKNINWALTEDGKEIRLNCVAHTGEQMNIWLKDHELTQFIGLLFDIARKSAEMSAPEDVQTRKIHAEPIPVTQMGAGPGKQERDAILLIRTGLIELIFSVDAGILLDTLKQLEAISRPIEKPSVN